jgi:Tfp pilus assembly protein PilN
MAARKPHIDLLMREDFSKRAVGRFLLWALTVGRYIAIFTELVVIAGVIARFVLDQQRNNITENIIEQQAILASYESSESKIRRVYQQLKTVSAIDQERLEADNLLTLLPQLTPVDMKYDFLNISKETVEITGATLTIEGFSAFLTNLYNNLDFEDIILNSLQTGGPQDPSIHFQISIEFKPEVKQEIRPQLKPSEVAL